MSDQNHEAFVRGFKAIHKAMALDISDKTRFGEDPPTSMKEALRRMYFAVSQAKEQPRPAQPQLSLEQSCEPVDGQADGHSTDSQGGSS